MSVRSVGVPPAPLGVGGERAVEMTSVTPPMDKLWTATSSPPTSSSDERSECGRPARTKLLGVGGERALWR